MKIPPIGTCVHVGWLDSTTSAGWNHVGAGKPTPAEPRRMNTYGILSGRSGVAITVTPTKAVSDALDSREGHLDPLTIPLGCILSIRKFPCE